MTGPFHYGLQGKASLFDHFHHYQQRVLDQRKTGGGIEIGILLFFPGVWGMIRGQNRNPTLFNGFSNGCAILLRFDRRVAFDLRTQFFITGLLEPQVMYASLRSDSRISRSEKSKFLLRGDV